MTISATDIVVPVCSKIPLLYLLTQKVAQKFGYVLGIGKRQGSICHDDKWRIDPLSCSSSRSVDNMAVWWFRATCFHGLKYLCVNREVTVQLPSSLHIRVNNIQERENQTKIPGKWGKKRLRIFP